MATSLYDLSVGSYQQTLGAVSGFLEKGLAHFTANNISPEEIVETRLFPDMLPLRFQLLSVAHHSLGAIEGLKQGQFAPPSQAPSHDYRTLQKLIADTRASIAKLTPDDVNALDGKDIIFQMRDLKLPFTAADFILSFSLPNFHFHAATAYDILRMKGVPLGKRDFMGSLRIKR